MAVPSAGHCLLVKITITKGLERMCLVFRADTQFSHRSQLVSIGAKKVNRSDQTRVTTEAGDGGCRGGESL